MKLLLGDCLYKLKELEDNSVDSIVTDPPYGLSAAPNSGKTSKGGFMGKQWDYDVPSQEIWEECIRVLKPGGHLLSFAGSRTYHRMAVRIEDAGFEIRDQIMWVYGSGFPKSMNIGKGVDKKGGQNLSWFIDYVLEVAEEKNISKKELTMLFPSKNGKPTGWLWNKKNGDGITLEQYNTLKDFLDLPFDTIEETEREIIRTDKAGAGFNKKGGFGKTTIRTDGGEATTEWDVTKGNSEWEGWGTALKPAHEPIVMARKPLSEKTVVDNVLEWGTGGINIDESRIEGGERDARENNISWGISRVGEETDIRGNKAVGKTDLGRFPANIIFDEEAGKLLDEQSGISKSTGGRIEKKTGWGEFGGNGNKEIIDGEPGFGDTGGASRFFYCPKTSKKDRNEGLDGFEEKIGGGTVGTRDQSLLTGSGNIRNNKRKNHHPTVKPTSLMLYLIRLVTPKGGTTLDPFMGSGSTGKAAVRGGFNFIGIEMEEEYFQIAEARIQYEKDNPYNEERGERIETNKNANKFF